MRKIDGKSEYLQLEDILFMDYIEMEFPKSLKKKFFEYTKFHTLFRENEKEYIELDTQEEKQFIKKSKFIYTKNYLDALDYNLLYEEAIKNKNSITEQYKKDVKNSIDIDEDIEYIKMKYKYNSLVDYIYERIEKSCKTCENENCKRDDSKKIGLDKEGKPMGYNCLIYKNKLQNVETIKS